MSKIHWSTAVSADFNTAADWSTSTVPGAADDAILDASGKTAYTVTASTSETVKSIQTAATATLSITAGTFNATTGTGTGANAGTITVGGNSAFQVAGTVTNNGVISLSNTAAFANLIVGSGGVSLTGAGQVTLTNNAANQIFGTGGVQTLTNVDNTISGAGFIGGGSLILNNQAKGIINSTGTTNALTLDMGFGTATNVGLIESTGKGGLILQNGSIANSGQITVSGGGALSLNNATINDSTGGTLDPGLALSLNSSAIVGGSLTMAAGGTITIVNSDDLNTVLTNKGAINVGNNSQVTLHGTVTNNGVISLSNTAAFAILNVGSGGVSLTGAGQVTLTDNAANNIFGTGGVQTLTNVDNTISGAGFIGGGSLILVNQAKGVIDATGATNALIIDAAFGTLTNAGLLEGTGAAGLTLQNGTINGAKGTVFAGAGSSVRLQNIVLTGGSLGTAAGGVITLFNGSTATVDGALANAGMIALTSTGTKTSLIFDKATTLTGGGTVSLGDNANNIVQGTSKSVVLTNVDNTISGSGSLGNGRLTLINQAAGVIDATGVAALILDAKNATLVNAGLIEATGAGGLNIKKTTIDNGSTGIILAGVGAKVRLQGADIIGGTLKSSGSGKIVTGSGVNILDGLTSTLNNQATVSISDNTALTLQGAIVNTGQISLSASAKHADLIVGAAGATLTGGGSVILGDNAGNRFFGASGTASLTNVDNTISGAGLLGMGTLVLVNQAAGVINASGTLALTIDTGANTITNAGLIEATGSGGGVIQSAVKNTGMLAAAGGDLTVNGAVTGNGSATINGATLDLGSSFTENVTFTGTSGVLELAQSQTYAGKVTGFSLTGGTSLDLRDIAFVSAGEATFSGNKTSGVLTVTDGTHTAHITLIGNYTGSTFVASSDGQGGVSIVDPQSGGGAAPAALSPIASASGHQFIAAMAGLGGGSGGPLSMWFETRHTAPMSLVAPKLHAA